MLIRVLGLAGCLVALVGVLNGNYVPLAVVFIVVAFASPFVSTREPRGWYRG